MSQTNPFFCPGYPFWRYLSLLLSLLLVVACSKLDDASLNPVTHTADNATLPRPALGYEPHRQAFFGDLHIHTELSTDAYIMGVRAMPEDVYRFAQGEPIEHGAGYEIAIARPLDFVAVTDHAEYLGQARLADLDVPTTRRPLADLLGNGRAWEITLAWLQTSLQISNNGFSPAGAAVDPKINRAAWQLTIDAAERHNRPGTFTTFIGYEWSGDAGDITAHMHRNVIYRSAAVSDLPFSQLDSNRPEDLWRFLASEQRQGRIALAIPHNGNMSKGNLYAPLDSQQQPFDAEYANLRSTFEPISEILQIKGSSETHPLLSPEDEFADFEILQDSLFVSETTLDSVQGGYLRQALRVGLALEHGEGFNPFRYGVLGSSDSHNASSPSDEWNYTGKLPMLDGSAGLRTDLALALPSGINPVTSWGSGGLAGVWAEENTRDALFAALQRRETFATSGPRIRVRLFGGWEFTEQMLQTDGLLERAYALGVPMGGQLPPAATQAAPSFLLLAWKDPDGANLDRAQIVKGWVDGNGDTHERVFDVAAADGRVLSRATGRLPKVGSTVDLQTVSYANSIGGTAVEVVWQDPEFEPEQAAFYYARVLEIPTPRWSSYDALTLGIEPPQPATLQERAISSAIWYSPALDPR